MTHLLVTNDYPPKIGGIQSYLYELWSRLPPESFAVLTLDHPGAKSFDAAASHRIIRLDRRMLLPSAQLAATIEKAAADIGASLVVLDPALPLGALGASLSVPYGLVIHGAEVTVPGRLPVLAGRLARVLSGARLVIAAGNYPEREARRLVGARLPTTVVIPPGVDTDRFHPLAERERQAVRARFGVKDDDCFVMSISRLVPRKGMDVLIEAAARLFPDHPDLKVVIGGTGRDEDRLRRLIGRLKAPVQLVGAVQDEDLAGLYGAADIFAMLCRDRWLGLEQEGFGIVFLEAAAAGIVQLAGRSGGSMDAVEDQVTGLVIDRPGDAHVATNGLRRLVDDEALRSRLGRAGRQRAVQAFRYDHLAKELDEALRAASG